MAEWKPVVGYEGLYEVSDGGGLRACEKVDYRGNRRKARAMHPCPDPAGYYRAILWRDGNRKTWKLHHLVLLAFVGPRPEGLHGCHADGDCRNNSAGNLRWDTISSNVIDNVRLGTHVQARKTQCPQGHEYTAANTVEGFQRGGARYRRCRTCQRRQTNESAARHGPSPAERLAS